MSPTRCVHEVKFADGRSAPFEELVSGVIPSRLHAVLYEGEDLFHERLVLGP